MFWYIVEAIEAFQKLSSLKQPGFQASYEVGSSLAIALHEPRYWDSPDALNVFDLSPSNQDRSIDRIRLWLQRVIPNNFLDIWGKERREIDQAAAKLPQPAKKTTAHDGRILEDIGPRGIPLTFPNLHLFFLTATRDEQGNCSLPPKTAPHLSSSGCGNSDLGCYCRRPFSIGSHCRAVVYHGV